MPYDVHKLYSVNGIMNLHDELQRTDSSRS